MQAGKRRIIAAERMIVVLPVQIRSRKPAVGKAIRRFQPRTRNPLVSGKNKTVLVPRNDRPVPQFLHVIQPVLQLRMILMVRGNAVPYLAHPLPVLNFRHERAQAAVPQVQALALVLAGPSRLEAQVHPVFSGLRQGKGVGTSRLQIMRRIQAIRGGRQGAAP